MTTRFLCLANSKKYTQRCIAGIVLEPTAAGMHTIVRHSNGQPRWIRPLSHSDGGEVPEESVKHINLLDIVEISGAQPAPHGIQQENCLFDDAPFNVIRSIPADPVILDKLVTPMPEGLFGDRQASIPVDSAGDLAQSLILVKVEEATPHFAQTSYGRVQTRLCFILNGIHYDLPVTDIGFLLAFYRDCFVLRGRRDVYCTVSLGQPYNGHYFKLVAGILYA